MKFRIWQSVTPTAADDARTGQAGYVCALDPKKPDEVGVKWDVDGVEEVVSSDSVRPLAG